jgi:hypothetical protein
MNLLEPRGLGDRAFVDVEVAGERLLGDVLPRG